MRTLVLLLLKVQIMLDRLIASLGRTDGSQDDRHVELAPSLLLDQERRALDDLLLARPEGFVQVVRRLLVAAGVQVVAVRADKEDGDGPLARRDAAFHVRLVWPGEGEGC